MRRRGHFLVWLGLTALFVGLTGGGGFYIGGRAHIQAMAVAKDAPFGCRMCHEPQRGPKLFHAYRARRYRSPMALALSPDGRSIYVAAEGSDALLVVDAQKGEVVREVAVGPFPRGVAVSPDGRRIFVSCTWANEVWAIDSATLQPQVRIAVGAWPYGLVCDPEGRWLFVANGGSDDVSVVDLATLQEVKRLAAGREPYDLAYDPVRQRVYVANRLAMIVPPRTPPYSELTVLDTKEGTVVVRYRLPSAHLLEGIAVEPRSGLVLTTLMRPKNLLPATQVARGWMVTNGLGVLWPGADQPAQVLLDEANAFFADPSDVVFTPDGRYAFVSHSGVNQVSVVAVERLRAVLDRATPFLLACIYPNHLGLSSEYVVKRLRVGKCPKGMAVSPDGRFVYVANRLDDTLSVIGVEGLEVVGTIELGGPRRKDLVRRGEEVFNSALSTFQEQFSCRSCHPDGHVDGLQYDFEPDGLGRGIFDNRTLHGISDVAPYTWDAHNQSLYKQCGFRFATFLMRAEPFDRMQLTALVAFEQALPLYPNPHRPRNGSLTPAQQRGKAIFERTVTNDGKPIPKENRCITCHPPPYYTDRRRHDVGSKRDDDHTAEFDTPQLTNVFETAPYLHDGSAATLEEIWTIHNPNDTHGVSNDMTKEQLNDLIEYLKSL